MKLKAIANLMFDLCELPDKDIQVNFIDNVNDIIETIKVNALMKIEDSNLTEGKKTILWDKVCEQIRTNTFHFSSLSHL